VFVDLFLVNAYRQRKLEGARVVVSRRMAANGMAVRCKGFNESEMALFGVHGLVRPKSA
jgi:hypothetical protein